MMKPFLIASGLAAVLTGCVSVPPPVVINNPAPPPHISPPAFHPYSQNFSCKNGLTGRADFINNHQVRLGLDGATGILNRVEAGSGARYVSNTGMWGNGAEWHQKGKEAFFGFKDPFGNLTQTICYIN